MEGAPRLRNASRAGRSSRVLRPARCHPIPAGRSGLVEFKTTFRFPYDASGRRSRSSFTALALPTSRWSAPPGAGKSTGDRRCCIAPSIRQSGIPRIDGMEYARIKLTRYGATSAWWFQESRCYSTFRSPTICASASPTPPERNGGCSKQWPARRRCKYHRARRPQIFETKRRLSAAAMLSVGDRSGCRSQRAIFKNPAAPDP